MKNLDIAEAQKNALPEALEAQLATKIDLREVKNELKLDMAGIEAPHGQSVR